MRLAKRAAIPLLGLAAVALSFVFVLRQLRGLSASTWTGGIGPGHVPRLAVSFAVYLIANALIQVAWGSLLASTKPERTGRTLRPTAIAMRAQIAKYLPGNVVHFGGRQMLAARLDWPQRSAAAATVVEIVSLPLVAIFIVGICLLLGVDAQLTAVNVPILGVAVLGAAIVAVSVLWVASARFERFDGVRADVPLFRRVSGGVALSYAGFFVLSGIAQSILMPSVGIGAVIMAATVAWVVGYLAPGVPAGIGVREALFLLVLGSNVEGVVFGTLLFRIEMVVADVALLGIGLVVERRCRRADRLPRPESPSTVADYDRPEAL